MRPVVKGPAPANLPVVNLANDIALAQSLNLLPAWNFTQQAVANAYGVAGPPLQLTPYRALYGLLVLAGAANPPQTAPTLPPPGGVIPTRALAKLAKQPLNDKVTAAYQQAAVALGTQMGKFCCYCDQALPGQIAVEHVLPKAPYPLLSISWATSCWPARSATRTS